jgi:hypothetical protein
MLEVEWMLRRAQVVDDMEVEEYVEMDTLTEQFRLLDVWLDSMEVGYTMKDKASECLGDDDEDMKDISQLCVRLGVEEMELEDVSFTWGEEVMAHMEIDTILSERQDEHYADEEQNSMQDIQMKELS